ncbi:NmrA/HSCARG family protein [Actinopolymorpha singaporensis]
MPDTRSVLVTGATGNQGGAAARALLERGWSVRAYVRDPAKPAARALADLGAELATGDLDDPDALRAAMTGVHGVFSVQPLATSAEQLAAEVRQGESVADLAAQSGVAHLVYSSVGGAERHTGVDHFETKAEVERHIARLGLPATVLRPVYFMNNLLYFDVADGERVVNLPLRPDRPLQLVAADDIGWFAADDIGWFAADAFDHPDSYLGRQLELAGDQLTLPEIAAAFEQVTGVPTRYHAAPITSRMYEWFAESGYQADIAALRERHPDMLTFTDFLTRRLAR